MTSHTAMTESPIFGPLNHQQDWIDVFDNILDTTNVYTIQDNGGFNSSNNDNVAETADIRSTEIANPISITSSLAIPYKTESATEVCTISTRKQIKTSQMAESVREIPHQPNDESRDPSTGNSSGSDDNDDVKAKVRSEKKRSRERQRRSDVNTQFDDLTTLLRRVECETTEGTRGAKYNNPTNRIDLIARTISVLERTHEENNKRRKVIEALTKQVDESKKRQEETQTKIAERDETNKKGMMMMVPMMMQQPGTSTPSMPMSHQAPSNAQYMPQGMSQGMAQGMPYCHMPPSMYSPHTTNTSQHSSHHYYPPVGYPNNYYPYAPEMPSSDVMKIPEFKKETLKNPSHVGSQPAINHQLQNMVGNLAHCA